ncbi:MAG: hypothetical protein AAFQ88_00480 [Pseudomonadota bacterium]
MLLLLWPIFALAVVMWIVARNRPNKAVYDANWRVVRVGPVTKVRVFFYGLVLLMLIGVAFLIADTMRYGWKRIPSDMALRLLFASVLALTCTVGFIRNLRTWIRTPRIAWQGDLMTVTDWRRQRRSLDWRMLEQIEFRERKSLFEVVPGSTVDTVLDFGANGKLILPPFMAGADALYGQLADIQSRRGVPAHVVRVDGGDPRPCDVAAIARSRVG